MNFLVLTFFIALVLAVSVYGSLKVPFNRESHEEIMLPMRDGVKLHTLIYFPRNSKDGTKKFPAVIDRSPYGYGDMEWITDIFLPFGFVAVGQDMRGTVKSEGNFTMWQSDADDSRDLGDWICSQEWSNGQIFTFGASADGIGSLQTIKTSPNWLAGQYIAWAPVNIYQILIPNGAYKQKTVEDWLLGVYMPTPEVVYDNIKTVYENEAHTYYWSNVEVSTEQYKNVRFPSAFWAGWYDLFLMGNLLGFTNYNTLSDESVRYTSKITVDPCGHCLEAADFFTENAIAGRTAVVIAQLFETFGIRPVARSEIKNVTFYVMSSNDDLGKSAGQYWTSLEAFPTPKMVDYYLNADKTATTTPKSSGETSTTYAVDPSNPIPTMGGNNLPDSIGGSIPCGPLDQSEVDKRADVINFQTEALSQELALTGPMFATLYVSSDAVDTDFMVRISDVYPTGEARLLQDNAVRMRWRENTLTPVYMSKGTVYKVEMNLWNTSYVVAPGHALRFSVSSSNWPRFSVNPHNGIILNDPAYPGQNITAQNTLYHSLKYASKVTLPVVNKRLQLPDVRVLKEVQTAYPQITDEVVAKATKSFAAMAARMKKV